MSYKIRKYLELADYAATRVTGSQEEWTAFLTTAARIYKYAYNQQLLIYLQRPDATACAEYDLWNDKMNRYVKRGSKGIAILDDSDDRLRLRYVFDISDTGTRRTSRQPFLWEYREEHEKAVTEALHERFGEAAPVGLAEQLERIAIRLAYDYWEENREDILAIVDGSGLAGYDEVETGINFRNAASISISYALLSRCGLEPGGYFESEDFQTVLDFNTSAASNALGVMVSQCNQEVLKEIGAAIKEYELAKIAERSNTHGEQFGVQTERGLSDSVFGTEQDTEQAVGQVRQDEKGVFEGTASRTLQSDVDEREAVSASSGDRGDGEQPSGADDAGTDERSGSDGGAESQQSDEVGWPDEQLQSAGGGDDSEGAYQQLSLSLFLSEVEQIKKIDEGSNVKAFGSFSIRQSDIDMVLCSGGNDRNTRLRIVAEYQKRKTDKEIAEFLKKECRGGKGFFTDSGKVSVWYGEEGIRLLRGSAARYVRTAQILSWEDAAKRIGELLEEGRFASNLELAEAEGYERSEFAQRLLYVYHDFSEKAKEADYLPSLRSIRTGGYPKEVEALSEKLTDEEFYNSLLVEYENFWKDYQKDQELLRFRYYWMPRLLGQLKELGLPRREYVSEITEVPEPKMFITEDEIDEVLRYGSLIEGGKRRIYSFFKEQHSSKERSTFLKDEYGIGGHGPAVSGATSSGENHDGKGIVLDKIWCEDVKMSWSVVAKRIAALILEERYLTEKDREKYMGAEPEPEVVAEAAEDEFPEEVSNSDKEYSVQAEDASKEVPMEVMPAAENFRITDNNLGAGGAKAKFCMNMDAIHTLHVIEREGRTATKEEQEVLAKYVGWGGLSDAFDESKAAWENEYQELKDALTTMEYEAARSSTLNAHYTSPAVIRAIYEAVGNMGFRTGNILEPSCGVGNFFGLLPEEMSDSRLYGVELDPITGRIAQQLYPKAKITVAGFETTKQRDFYDLAIGNVPFGQYKVNDPAYNKLGFSIHNYFFAKSLDQVRPGGVVAFITSRYMMDAKTPEVRRYLAQRAELLGAIRLPNNAFKANAGTEVVSDIIFLQKREQPIVVESEWVHLGQTEDGYAVNSYFAERPEMVLGKEELVSTAHGMGYTVTPIEGRELSEQLHHAVQNIHGTYQEGERSAFDEIEEAAQVIPADPNVKNYSYTVVGGEVYYREDSLMVRSELNATAKARVSGMAALRDCVNELIELQMDAGTKEETIKGKQTELNQLYDAFTARYGLINERGNRLAFSEDSSYYLLCALEILDEDGNLERKADMFTKQTIRPHRAATSVDTASEALAVSLGEKARVDLEYMEELTGKSADALTSELTGVIFKDPACGEDKLSGWQTADEYLSGNVRRKLRAAIRAAEDDPVFNANVEALKAAQLKDLDASEIEVRLGATWIDKSYVQQFMYEAFDTPRYLRGYIQVNYAAYTAEWQVSGKGGIPDNDIAAYTTYGTDRASAYKILEDSLNLRDVRIYDTVEDEGGRERRVLNAKETTLAAQKQQAIRDAFRDWIWKDPERRRTLVKQYNEEMNSIRPREYDGSHIVFEGMNPEITLREHQRNAIAHVLYGGNTLLAHEVGAGKTFEMVAAAMESKRLGLCNKSIFVVPNHLTEQWASEFLRLYPSANILVTKKKDFETRNRKKFCARIATGDYDAVIIGHSQFERIPVSKERQERLLRTQIEEITEGIAEVQASGGERFTVKQLEHTKKNLEVRMEKLQAENRKDDVVTFEQLGVDRMFVDESHSYKNLFLYTKMRNVAGLSTSDAQKSSDMFAKCRYLDELTGGRGVVFATGTPVSNSMTELYTIQRYLQYDRLRELNMIHFDCWASRFGETVTALELAPEGTGYRARTRFSRFFNLPELMNLFKEVADIKTADQLNLPTPEVEYHNIVAKPTEHQQEMVRALSERAAEVHSGMVDPSIDNMLRITSDGRKLGLDQRIINALLPDETETKVNQCVGNLMKIWKEEREDKLTQLVFCDISTPNPDAEFTVYDDIRTKLIRQGVPEEEIAFIHDANTEVRKKELFAKVRTGQVRILMGSTFKMGAGMNVQDRLVALHDLDCPWRPGDLEQRKGRIVRQGNKNDTVHIYRYVTEGTFDSYLWQTVENKQRFISQIMTSKSPVRSCEDVDATALSFAEIKALCAGDPRIKERMDLDVEVTRLKLMKADHQSKQFRLEDNLLKYYPEEIEKYTGFSKAFQSDIALAAAHPHPEDGFAGMEVKGKSYTEKESAGEALLDACKENREIKEEDKILIGSYRGFSMYVGFDAFRGEYALHLRGEMGHVVRLGSDVRGNLIRIDNVLLQMPEELKKVQINLDNLYQQQTAAKEEVGKSFLYEEELQLKTARLVELDTELNMGGRVNPLSEQKSEKEKKPSVLEGLKRPLPAPGERKGKSLEEVR